LLLMINFPLQIFCNLIEDLLHGRSLRPILITLEDRVVSVFNHMLSTHSFEHLGDICPFGAELADRFKES